MSLASSLLSSVALRLSSSMGPTQVELDDPAGRVLAWPSTEAEVVDVLRLARENKLRVRLAREGVVAGNKEPPAPSLARANERGEVIVNLARLSHLVGLDETSLLVHAQAGVLLGSLVERLQPYGVTAGSVPRESYARTLGAALAAPRASEASPRGTFVDRCAAVEAVLPDGTRIRTRLAPRKATGPDLLHTLLGARGKTGIITSAWLRLDRKPTHHSWLAFAFSPQGASPAADDALSVALELLHRGVRPAELQLADAGAIDDEALRTEMRPGEVLLAVELASARELLAVEETLVTGMSGRSGARGLVPALVENWLDARRAIAGSARQNDRSERFVATDEIKAAWSARIRPARLLGLRPAGGALLEPDPGASSDLQSAVAAVPSAVDKLRSALVRRLDPDGLLGG